MIREVLGPMGLPAIAEREKQKASLRPDQAPAKLFETRGWRIALEDDLLVNQRVACQIEPGPQDANRRGLLGAVSVRQPQNAACQKLRVYGYVEEPSM